MRILFLAPHLPSPPTSGGGARMHGLISELAGRHEVAVLAFRGRGANDREAVEATGRYARLVVAVENPHLGVSMREKRIGQLRSLLAPASFERRVYGLPSLQRSFDRVVREWRPDVVVIEFAQMGYLRFPPEIPVVLDAHNLEHEIILRSGEVEGSFARRAYSRINAFKLKREEMDLVRRVDGLAVTSERDGEAFARLFSGFQPVVVPNAVDTESFRPPVAEADGLEILFFGAMDYFPNADAVLYFYREIWPGLKRTYPELRFNIVGRDPSPEVRALGDSPGVTVTGLVDDVREWIGSASVVVVPLRAGSGTRLKVLEAMAMGRPVVSTSLGVEGLDVEPGTDLVVADSAAEFRDAVSMLLGSVDERRRLGDAARALVEDRYDWRRSARELDRLLEDVTARRAGAD
ncbi:MAG: glycosyltransferase family 4 protein [Thermomicrobiales bacterium]